MGVMDINSDLEGFKALKVSLVHTPKQIKYLTRDLTDSDENILWNELKHLRGTTILSFREIGRRLKELQERYSKKGSGEFEKRYSELGFKKMEVYTFIKKYDLFLLDAGTEESILLDPPEKTTSSLVNEPEEIEEAEIVRTVDNPEMIGKKLEGASQRIIGELEKSPKEVRGKFYSGEITTATEIKNERKIITPGKTLKAAVIEDDRRSERVKELTKELKDIDREITELLETERKLKRLREQRAEVVEELSKVNNLKLDFNEDPVYKNLMEHLIQIKNKRKGVMTHTKIDLKDDWWRSRAYEWWQENKDTLGLQWYEIEEKYCV
ncbi:hypothetical protein PM10SUCC1_28440 [Propionigenium maris DSM 9537]|uniref:Uncharacterized protein n=1 Tax=Propionigenium maris DSM 9537 TaxID=1123000 RepID=A0A9W6GNS1_9FUSO|nr:hypothetical protein [Propionigenium maris]GLI57330.1 hypothetical protein PM10SUCC1_28440 [Propionigenium maris DSM 9537]